MTPTVGSHRLRLQVPTGWQHQHKDSTHSFHKNDAVLVLKDLGIFTRLAVIRQIEKAQRRYTRGYPTAAQALIEQVPYFQATLLQSDDWLAVEAHWQLLSASQKNARSEHILQAYGRVLNTLYQQPDIDLTAIVQKLLQRADRSGQREIDELETLAIDGRSAIRAATQDRLSHGGKRHHLFILNEDSVLELSALLGSFDATANAFTQLATSLSFLDTEE